MRADRERRREKERKKDEWNGLRQRKSVKQTNEIHF